MTMVGFCSSVLSFADPGVDGLGDKLTAALLIGLGPINFSAFRAGKALSGCLYRRLPGEKKR